MIKSLSNAQRARFPEFVDKWTKIGLCTDPADRPSAELAIKLMYKYAKLEEPRIVWCSSPLVNVLTRASVLKVGASVRTLVEDSVRDSVWASVEASVGDSVRDSVEASVGDSVRDSVEASVEASVWDSVGASVRTLVEDSVRTLVRDSVGASVRTLVGDSVWASVRASVWASVRDSVEDSVGASVRDSVEASVWDSVEASVEDSVWASVRDSVGDSVWASVKASVGDSVWASVWASVRTLVEDSVGASVRDSVEDSVWDSVEASVGDSVRTLVWDSVKASVRDSVWDSVWASVWASVRDSVGDSVWASVRASVRASCYGQHDASWLGFYDFFKQVLNLDKQTSKLEGLWLLAQSANWAIPLKHICWVSERHNILRRDNDGRLHCADDIALAYPDGWGVYALHGVRMKPEYVLTPADKLDTEIILKEGNTEVRRELIRKVGIERIISKAKVVDNWNNYRLLDFAKFYDDESYVPFLLMVNPSTGGQHLERVSAECKTVEQALNWRKPEALQRIPVSDNGEDWYQQGDVCIWPEKAIIIKPLPIVIT